MFDLSSGLVFEQLPIVRIIFCDGSTLSLPPAALWRGHCTVGSVLNAVIWMHQEGRSQTAERISRLGDGDNVPDESTLRRWQDFVRRRLIGSAMAALGPQLHLSWSDQADPVAQLIQLQSRLTPALLLSFRSRFGHAVLDKPQSATPANPPDSTKRLVADPQIPPSPHTLPSAPASAGRDSCTHSRDPPKHASQEASP